MTRENTLGIKTNRTSSTSTANQENHMNIQSKTIIATVVSICLFAAAARADTITLVADAGFTLTWDGNESDFFGSAVSANLAQGGTAFSSGGFNTTLVNNGTYGNDSAWRGGASGPPAYVGVPLGGLFELDSVAWGRDNGGEATQFTDRFEGSYELQFTQVASPGTGTTDTGNPLTGWDTIGLVTYVDTGSATLGYRRHEFEIGLSAGGGVAATGFRILTTPISPNTSDLSIDELELYGAAAEVVPEPSTLILAAFGLVGLAFGGRRRSRG